MPDDVRTVSITFDVDPDTAAALQDPVVRARVGRLIGGLIRAGADQAAPVIEESNVETELHTLDSGAEAFDLIEKFRAFRAGKTLGGLDLKEMISEGRR